jgi:hypothetical protein
VVGQALAERHQVRLGHGPLDQREQLLLLELDVIGQPGSELV